MNDEIRVVFDGPPGPEAGRFVEVENIEGASIRVGVWHERDDGFWELRISGVDLAEDAAVRQIIEEETRETELANSQFGVGA